MRELLKLTMEPPDINKYYPRVLLVNVEPISRRTATGITMGNLFRGWSRDRIAQIYCDEKEPDESICGKSWKLEVHDLIMPEWVRNKFIDLRRQSQQAAATQNKPAQPETFRTADIKTQAVRIMKKVFLRCLEFSSFRIGQELDAWVRDFKPDVIYSVLGNLHMLKLVQDISGRLMVPVVPHFMDDWIVSLPSEILLDKYLKLQLLKRTRQIMRDAPVMLVIGEAMAEEYHKRYGYVFLPFMNCIESTITNKPKCQVNNRNEFRFVYAGGLHLGRWELLQEIGQALTVLSDFGVKSVIDIYTVNISDEILAEISKQNIIKYKGVLSPEKVINVISVYDGLLHLDSFEEQLKEYTRFSISAKLPEYFSSGTAIFAYGPEDIASINYITANNCGMVVGSKNQSLLKNSLSRFIYNSKERTKMSECARKLCIKNHDALIQREKFRLELAKCQ